MNADNSKVEMLDAQLQERAGLVTEDNARPAEQIINEQMTERAENESTSAPRFVP